MVPLSGRHGLRVRCRWPLILLRTDLRSDSGFLRLGKGCRPSIQQVEAACPPANHSQCTTHLSFNVMGLHLDAEESFCKGSTEPPPQRNGFHPCSSSEAVHSSGNGVVLPLSLQGRAETIPAGGQTSLAERLNEAGSGFLAEASHVQPPKPTGNVQQSSSGPAKGGREPVRRSHVPAEPLQLPDTVEVVCGTTLGVLQLKKLRVSFDGEPWFSLLSCHLRVWNRLLAGFKVHWLLQLQKRTPEVATHYTPPPTPHMHTQNTHSSHNALVQCCSREGR